MKKSIIFGLVLPVVFAAFSACDHTDNTVNNTDPADERPYLLSSDSSGNTLNVQYIRTEYTYIPGDPFPVTVTFVSSTDELEQYYEENRRQIFDGHGNMLPDEYFLNAIKPYDDAYFINSSLIIVWLTEGSGSNRHKVEGIDENGNITIKRLVPEIGTADMAAWSVVIELDNNHKKDQYQVVFVN